MAAALAGLVMRPLDDGSTECATVARFTACAENFDDEPEREVARRERQVRRTHASYPFASRSPLLLMIAL
jgi:hypothetical protein